MTFQEALKIKIDGTDDWDLSYVATMAIELAVLEASEYGDPDSSLQDWISAGQYKPTDTPESIAAEWDGERD